MKEQRILKRDCMVGEYTFEIAVNRQIVLDAFKQCPELWKILYSNTKTGVNESATDDIETFARLLDDNDLIEEEIPRFIGIILPEMLALAGDTETNAAEFLEYCVENEVDDQVNGALMEFAMLGFTEGKSAKKPKVKVAFK